MASLGKTKRSFFSKTGTGDSVEVFPFADGNSRITAQVIGHLMRQAVGGGATAVDVYLVCGELELADWGTPADLPEDVIVFKITGATPTASATVPFSVGPVGAADRHPVSSGRSYLVFDVTATGAWTMTGYVEFLGS